MGGLLPASLAAAGLSRDRVRSSVSRLYAGNATGGVLGAAAAGCLLIPTLGISGTVHLVVFIYLAVGNDGVGRRDGLSDHDTEHGIPR